MSLILEAHFWFALWFAAQIPLNAPPPIEMWCFPPDTVGVGGYLLCPDNAPKVRAA